MATHVMRAAQSEVDRLRRENERLREKVAGAVVFKPSAKGCLSMYGLRRFPISLYKSEWREILNRTQEIEKALEKYADRLSEKD